MTVFYRVQLLGLLVDNKRLHYQQLHQNNFLYTDIWLYHQLLIFLSSFGDLFLNFFVRF